MVLASALSICICYLFSSHTRAKRRGLSLRITTHLLWHSAARMSLVVMEWTTVCISPLLYQVQHQDISSGNQTLQAIISEKSNTILKGENNSMTLFQLYKSVSSVLNLETKEESVNSSLRTDTRKEVSCTYCILEPLVSKQHLYSLSTTSYSWNVESISSGVIAWSGQTTGASPTSQLWGHKAAHTLCDISALCPMVVTPM